MRLTTSLASLILSARLVASVSVDAATFANTSFDFIVAGGGTAGVAVAVRYEAFLLRLFMSLNFIPGFLRLQIGKLASSRQGCSGPTMIKLTYVSTTI